jgi:hypothetical protein
MAEKVTEIFAHHDMDLAEVDKDIRTGEITHAVVSFRRQDGSLCYRSVGDDHGTYLVGMLQRVAWHMMAERTVE